MKKKLTEEEFINMWLMAYHAIDLEGVKKAHPEWMENPEKHTRDFYRTYAVTQAQHDEWYERDFCLAYLNVAPSIKGDVIF